jgi:hypothetical protein
MTGPEHYREGERLLDRCAELPKGSDRRASVAAEANAHFLAALVAAVTQTHLGEYDSWQKAVGW